MTYALGWKTESSIFMIADTGVTSQQSVMKNMPMDGLPSSLGEFNEYIKNKITEEIMFKVNNIGKDIIYSFAGDVAAGHKFSLLIKQALEYKETRAAIQVAVNSSTPLNSAHSFSAMIGFMDDDLPCLLGFNINNDNRLTEEHEIIHLGSGTGLFQPATSSLVNTMKEMDYKRDDALVYTAAFLQHFSIHNQLAKVSVGGVFFGGLLNKDGFKWMHDTTYILYADNGSQINNKINKVTVIFRDDFLIINSSLNNMCKFISVKKDSNDTKKLTALSKKYLNHYKSDYFIFLSKKWPIVTLAEVNNKFNNEYFSVNEKEILIKGELNSMLVNFLEKDTGCQFQWITALQGLSNT